MRPVNAHRKLRIRGDSIGSSTRYKLADPITPGESSRSRLDFSASEDGLDSAQKVQTLPDCRPLSKEKNLLEKTKTSSKPNLTAFSLKNLVSFPEIVTERGKLYPPQIFEKNLYEKNQRMIKMTKMISDYMAEKIVKRTSSLSSQVQNSQKSLNYVILGKNPESTQTHNTTAEQLGKRQSLPPPSHTLRRLNTDVEERPRMRIRHQNSIESSNSSNIPLATFFKNSEKSKSPQRLEKIKNYSRSPDEKTDLNPNSLEKIANNFFVKNKDKFHIATPLKKRAAELSKEQFASTKAEWLKKALAFHRSKLKPQFKAL